MHNMYAGSSRLLMGESPRDLPMSSFDESDKDNISKRIAQPNQISESEEGKVDDYNSVTQKLFEGTMRPVDGKGELVV